jgi:hypothetical protein
MTARLQVGAIWQESSMTTTGWSAEPRDIVAGSLLVGVFKAETSSIEIGQTVTDTAGGTWTVVPSYYGSVNSHILYSYNHPGGTGVVISGSFTGGTVAAADTKIRFAEFDGLVGEADPITESVTSGGSGVQLSHTHTVPTDGFTLAVQGSYYGAAFTLTSPATLLVYVYNTMNASIQLSTGASVLHSGGGGAGQQANVSVTVAPIPDASDTAPPNPSGLTATPTSSSLVDGHFATDEPGTGYFLVSNNATEVAATVEAGAHSASATIGAGCSITGLAWTAGQYLHAVQKDSAPTPNWSSVLSILIADAAYPVATGPLTIGNVTPTGCRVGGFSATDNLAVTGWRYRLDAGSWVTFGDGSSTFFDLTGLTTDATVVVDVEARDAAGNWSNTLSKTFVVGTTTVTVTGLDFRPVGARSATLKSPDFPSYTLFTHIWWEWVEDPAGPYYAGGFILSLSDGTFSGGDNYIMPVLHGTDGTFNSTTGQRTALAASPMHHEIATDGSDFIASPPGLVLAGETQESFPAQYGAWVMRGCQARVVGSNLEIANYVDLSDPAKVIRHAVATSSITGSAVCFNLGQVPWATEEFRAKVFGLGVYTAYLTPAQMVSELNNFTNTPGVANCWFRNVFPAMSGSTLSDLKGSTPNDMTLRTGYTPDPFTEDIEVAPSPAVDLSASAVAQAGAGAQLLKGVSLSGAGLAVAGGSASMSHVVPLAASAVAAAVTGGQLALAVQLSGAAIASAAASAGMSLAVPLAADGVAQAGASADLSTNASVDLSADAQATASASAVLSLTVSLGAAAVGQALASAALAKAVALGADGTAQADGAASLQVGAGTELGADATGQASAGASLWLDVPLGADALAQALAGGSLSLAVLLGADALANVSGSAMLAANVQLSADGQVIATATAGLQVMGALEQYKRALRITPERRIWTARPAQRIWRATP